MLFQFDLKKPLRFASFQYIKELYFLLYHRSFSNGTTKVKQFLFLTTKTNNLFIKNLVHINY